MDSQSIEISAGYELEKLDTIHSNELRKRLHEQLSQKHSHAIDLWKKLADKIFHHCSSREICQDLLRLNHSSIPSEIHQIWKDLHETIYQLNEEIKSYQTIVKESIDCNNSLPSEVWSKIMETALE